MKVGLFVRLLVEESMERGYKVPCRYKFTGSEKNVKKMKELLADKKAKSTVLVPFL